MDKISFKNDTKCIISHCHMSDMKHEIYTQIHWVTHTP